MWEDPTKVVAQPYILLETHTDGRAAILVETNGGSSGRNGLEAYKTLEYHYNSKTIIDPFDVRQHLNAMHKEKASSGQ